MPLPPYIAAKRPPDAQDRDGLSDRLCPRSADRWRRPPRDCISPQRCWSDWRQRAIGRADVTLHVGAGTFLPVTAEDITSM